jgi:hypothetical protein
MFDVNRIWILKNSKFVRVHGVNVCLCFAIILKTKFYPLHNYSKTKLKDRLKEENKKRSVETS